MIRRMLAIGHDASRTGAPATLLELLRWAHQERGVEVTTVLLAGGPLVDAFAEIGTVRAFPPALLNSRQAASVLGHPRWSGPTERAWLRRALAPAAGVDVVIASSAASLRALPYLPRPAPPVVAHLHELDGVLDALGGSAHLAALAASAALTVVPSDAVADLVSRRVGAGGLGLPARRVRRHPEPVRPPARHPRPDHTGAALVVGCGTIGWRKGTDLFVALAHAVGPEVAGREVRWAWIGGDSGDGTAADVRDEIGLRGLTGRVHLTGEVDDAPLRLAAADILTVTSREDPYPLVAVEAALAGTPVVGFRPGTTLLAEAGQDSRRVDHLDVEVLATQVAELLTAPDRGRLLAGDQARAATGATTPLVAPALWADIEAAATLANGIPS